MTNLLLNIILNNIDNYRIIKYPNKFYIQYYLNTHNFEYYEKTTFREKKFICTKCNSSIYLGYKKTITNKIFNTIVFSVFENSTKSCEEIVMGHVLE